MAFARVSKQILGNTLPIEYLAEEKIYFKCVKLGWTKESEKMIMLIPVPSLKIGKPLQNNTIQCK